MMLVQLNSITPEAIHTLGMCIGRGPKLLPVVPGLYTEASARIFKSMYGVSPKRVSYVLSEVTFPRGTKPGHVLWALLLLKCYTTELTLARMTGVSANTFRKWSWLVIGALAAHMSNVVSTITIDFILTSPNHFF